MTDTALNTQLKQVKHQLHLRQRWHEVSKLPRQCWAKLFEGTAKRAVLLAGYQRSGTNMLMQALDRHPLTSVFHENDPRVFENYSLKPASALYEHFYRAPGRLIVVKCLLDAHRYAELSDNLADICGEAPLILWPMRALDDVVNSHMVRWPDSREHIDQILGEDSITTWRGRGLTPAKLDYLKTLSSSDISNADCKALGWMMRTLLLLNDDFPAERTRLVAYEKLVTNPEDTLRDLLRHCNLAWNPRVTEGIHARSISKNAPPALRPEIRAACEKLEQDYRQRVAFL